MTKDLCHVLTPVPPCTSQPLMLKVMTQKEREREGNLQCHIVSAFLSLSVSQWLGSSMCMYKQMKEKLDFILCSFPTLLVRAKYICFHDIQIA